MKLLDLFCGAGGAAVGYHRAGFTDITGIDNRPQKHYPFRFIQMDAFDYLKDHGEEFDFIHASPPCQAFTDLRHCWNAKRYRDLLTPTRELLVEIAKPWVIENVDGAPLQNPIMLCGTMFDLKTADGKAELWRHRYFESRWIFALTPECKHRAGSEMVIGVYGGHGRDRRRAIGVYGHCGGFSKCDGTQQFTVAQRREAMGIDWMTGAELSQAIPPVYTEWIGKKIIEAIQRS